MQRPVRFAVAALVVLFFGLLAQSAAQKKSDDRRDSALDPRGRMEGSPTDKPARYYVWCDDDGWHLRSCSKVMNRFDGSVRVGSATIQKCRPIGLESRGKRPDKWGLDQSRREIRFDIHTARSFDGFDFSVNDPSAELEFELRINGKAMPKRIFIGRDGAHPAQENFRLPANPERKRAD
jgi:hypothetical protein